MKKNKYVSTKDGKWQVKGEKNSKATAIYDTQREAIERAREISANQKSELIIKGKNGRIREKNSYGNDSYPPKG